MMNTGAAGFCSHRFVHARARALSPSLALSLSVALFLIGDGNVTCCCISTPYRVGAVVRTAQSTRYQMLNCLVDRFALESSSVVC